MKQEPNLGIDFFEHVKTWGTISSTGATHNYYEDIYNDPSDSLIYLINEYYQDQLPIYQDMLDDYYWYWYDFHFNYYNDEALAHEYADEILFVNTEYTFDELNADQLKIAVIFERK